MIDSINDKLSYIRKNFVFLNVFQKIISFFLLKILIYFLELF